MLDSDRVWNRACLELGGANPMEGDVALTAMVLLHGLAMNGGLLDAVEGMSEAEVMRAVAGFRYFGLGDAAAVVEWVAQQVRHPDPHDSIAEE